MADLSVLTAMIDRMAREWMPVSVVMPNNVTPMPVLVWNGKPHLATWMARFTVEPFVEGDTDGMVEEDGEGHWWMREGWYEQMECEQARAIGCDVWVEPIEHPPVTHWMLSPAPPEVPA